MRNVAPSRNLTRRSRNLIYFALVFALFGVLCVVIGFTLSTIPFAVPSNPDFGLYNFVRNILFFGGIIILLIAGVLLLRAFTWRVDNDLADEVGQVLANRLDNRYTFIRNVNKLSIGYIDAVLVGPPGVLVFRITDAKGGYFNEGSKWLRQQQQGKWRTTNRWWNPTKEAIVDVQRLTKYLQARDLEDVPVYGVVVFSHDAPVVKFGLQKPTVPVVYKSDFLQELPAPYFGKDRVDARVFNQLVKVIYG